MEKKSFFGYNNEVDSFETQMYLLSSRQFNQDGTLPEQFRLLNLNLWGIDKDFFRYSLLEKRLPFLVQEMISQDPEIITLQELSPTTLKYLYSSPLSQIYDFLEAPPQINWSERDTVSVSILTKKSLPRGQGQVYCLDGEQRYTAAMLEIGSTLLVNFHLQAGSSSSKGVHRDSATKYHLGRCEMLRLIQKKVKQKKFKNVIYAGDSNFDHNGEETDWPELKVFRELGWRDLWSLLRPEEDGYTEDSTNNTMRWNIKQQERHRRYDIIALNPESHLIEQSIQLVGTKPICTINPDEIMRYNQILHLDEKKFRLNDKGEMDWFLSDHFGLLATIAQNEGDT